MGLQDFEVFIRERLQAFDGTLDLTSGSPIDAQVIQPLLRRIGTDPFTVDAATFIVDRLSQEFPDLAAADGDAVSDLLAKPALLLWDPIIREIQRIKSSLSFRDPATLTADEADALGANLFASRSKGTYARGVGRIYFAQPQPISISPSNFFTSQSGLHFFPTGVQSIKSTEMLLNTEGSLYYFDINLVAESTGDEYNIEPAQLVTIANISSAVRVTNKARFRFGEAETDPVTFIGNIENSLSERSLVTGRGIASRLGQTFPEITRLNVVGFNDPEMQRDVLSGGGLGAMVAFGTDAKAYPDGEFKARTRRVQMPGANFLTTIGPAGPVKGWVLTLFGAYLEPPAVRDLAVVRVVDDQTIELGEQVVAPGMQNKAWALRKLELTLSGIPGGILYPDGPNGTVSVPPDQVHIGGCTDILVRGSAFDTASLALDLAIDDKPLLEGTQARLANGSRIFVDDYKLGVNYSSDDEIGKIFLETGVRSYAIEILDGPGAGIYRALSCALTPLTTRFLVTPPIPTTIPGFYRWRLIDEIHVDLVEPKQTRLEGNFGKTVQNVSVFTTSSAPPIDFDALGVSEGDTLRILSGLDKGDRKIEAISPPFYTQLVVDRPFTSSVDNVPFIIFRPNAAGGVKHPLLRVTGVTLLDTTGQPVGSKVPYAKPVEIQSSSFQNIGNGVKVELKDAQLGIVSIGITPGPVDTTIDLGAGGNLQLNFDGYGSLYVSLTGGVQLLSDVQTAINAVTLSAVGYEAATLREYNGQVFLGIVPLGPNTTTAGTDAAVAVSLFGDTSPRTSRDIRPVTPVTWASYDINAQLDSVWVLDGLQSGFYRDPVPDGAVLRVSHDFAPELARDVRVGSRSLGSARMYFLEPTSVEVDHETTFTTADANGNVLRYKPDPTLERQVYPCLPNGTKPRNGVAFDATTFQCTGIDFRSKGVRVGDLLKIDYQDLVGDLVSLADPVPGLALKQLRLSIDNQPDKFVTFVNDVGTPGAVGRKGVADQINAAVGYQVCEIREVTPGTHRLVFNPTVYLEVIPQLANPDSANALLGFSNSVESTNTAVNAGTYVVSDVAPSGSVAKLTVTPALPSPGSDLQQFSVHRVGSQRIVSTAMATQTSAGGLYYWDVELLSEGPGNLWNIPAEQEMVVAGYRSDGYYLLTEDANTTFSTAESIELVLSNSILEVGVDDDPENATKLLGQRLSVDYEYASLVQGVQSFISADSERVINQSPLARSLVPHYVRFDATYSGGSKPEEVLPSVKDYILKIQPDVALESSDIQGLILNKGASYIQNPIDLLAVVYNFDRTVTVVRSQDSLSTGRLAAFVPDAVTLTRRTA